MLTLRDQPSARRALHLLFAGEKVQPEYVEGRGLRLIPLADLVGSCPGSAKLEIAKPPAEAGPDRAEGLQRRSRQSQH